MRNYRHRNPKTGDEQKTASTPFFKSPKGSGLQRKKDSGFLQRLATSKEDEKLGTHDARMEKDKEEPMKPVQKKGGMDEKKKKGIHKMDDPEKRKKKVQKKGEDIASPTVEAVLEDQTGKGSRLPKETLEEMSHRFGVDFSDVRIHNDAAAAALCSELGAQAFTHGCDIYFNEGKYNPESEEGKRLLAHELTHVVQQHV